MDATHAVVDLAAIAHNVAAVKSLAGSRNVLVAVKANAYGHGARDVATMLEKRKLANWLGVATVTEGVQLRSFGISLPILKFSPCFIDEIGDVLAHDLTPTVVDEAGIAALQQAAQAADTVVSVHLKLDSGMRRLGAELSDGVRLATVIAAASHLRLGGLMTHLPISDCTSGSSFTKDELARFFATCEEIQRLVGPVEFIHAANSGAILGHQLGPATMVRAGIMAYGYYPDPTTPKTVELRPALSLHSRVSFVKQVRAGESVGYGRTWIAQRDTWIATVPIGYGDGYSRLRSNRGAVLIGGQRRPIRGRVCMDQLMVEVDRDVKAGDGVVLIGEQGSETITTDEVALSMGTITYEVTCLITPRVTRVYLDTPGSSLSTELSTCG